jgi:hypothetical protein
MTEIVVRKVKFEFPDELDDVFPGDDPIRETYLVAFSLTMPYLEPYLIRTYRSVLDQITDPELAEDVRKFSAQEAQHFQNHRRVNKIIKSQLGPDVAVRIEAIEQQLDADYHRFNNDKSPRFNLGYAEGFEAMTCAMAMSMFELAAVGEGLGSDGRFGPWQQLWAWHAAEEIEHRTVAFGVYEHFHPSWALRAAGALRAQIHFQRYIDKFQRVLLPTQGEKARPRVPTWMRDGKRRYFKTFLPNYDPGKLDVDPLVDMVLIPYTP